MRQVSEKDLWKLIRILYSIFLVYFIIALSGVLLFMRSNEFIISFFFILILGAFWVKIPKKNTFSFLRLIAIVVTIMLLQFYIFNVFVLDSFLSLIIAFSVGYLVNIVLKGKFVRYYVSLVYYLSLVSFAFYFSGLILPGLYTSFSNIVSTTNIDPYWTNNFLFFNFIEKYATLYGYQILRNSGFLYEPGMFACVLIPALSFNTIITNKLFNKENFVFLIALLTTFSTAAYLAILVFVIIYLLIIQKVSLPNIAVATFLIAIFAGYLWQTEFIGGKIEQQIRMTRTAEPSQQFRGRIGSALVDMRSIAEYPLIGRGRTEQMRFDQDMLHINPEYTHRTNGIFDLIVEMGIPFFILYVFLIYKSIAKFCEAQRKSKYNWIIFLVPFFIMAFSQTILLRPLFLSFLFIYPVQVITK